MLKLQSLVANSRLRIASVLALIWIVYLLFRFDFAALFFPLFSITSVAALDLLITYIRKRTVYLPASSVVTGFLIGLILPTNSPWPLMLAVFIAVLSKQFIRIREHQHLFNPAALGIFVTSLLTGIPIAWWAVSWSPWIIPFIIGASYTLYQLKRLWLPITFLAVYSMYLMLTTGLDELFPLFLDGTVFLFTFIMLPEPITSIATGKWQFTFGPLIALLSIIIGKVDLLTDVFLPALLLGNTIGFLAKRLSVRA